METQSQQQVSILFNQPFIIIIILLLFFLFSFLSLTYIQKKTERQIPILAGGGGVPTVRFDDISSSCSMEESDGFSSFFSTLVFSSLSQQFSSKIIIRCSLSRGWGCGRASRRRGSLKLYLGTEGGRGVGV